MRALGIRRKEQPDLVHLVQPVEIVGDHSGFSSQVLPPMAYMGGQRGAVAGVYSGMQFTSSAPGGSYIRTLIFGQGANALYNFTLVDTPSANANVVGGLRVLDIGSEPTVSRAVLCTMAAPGGGVAANQCPRIMIAGAQSMVLSDFIYVPAGQTLEFWDATVQKLFGLGVLFEDCPAQRAAR
jgi:hypothetical protein